MSGDSNQPSFYDVGTRVRFRDSQTYRVGVIAASSFLTSPAGEERIYRVRYTLPRNQSTRLEGCVREAWIKPEQIEGLAEDSLECPEPLGG